MKQKHRLISIAPPSDSAALDVLFVHGLTGGPYKTWGGLRDEPDSEETAGYETATPASMGDAYWPLSLSSALEARLGPQRVNVWSFGYPAPLLKDDDPYAYEETLKTAIRPAVRKLVQGGIGVGTRRGIVFIGHSLGGLVIKSILEHCGQSADPNERQILESTTGVAFVATPHGGSGLATLFTNLPHLLDGVGVSAKVITWLWGAPVIGKVIDLVTGFVKWFSKPSNQIAWLEKANSTLRELAEHYRDLAIRRRINTRAYYETQPLNKVAKNLLWIVDASNADPGVAGCLPVGVPYANHIEICKPNAENSFIRDDIEQWMLSQVTSREQGKQSAVLATDIAEICASVRRSNPARYNAVLATTPRNLEDIPADGDLRKDFSHMFRNEASKRLDLVLGQQLRSDSKLQTALEDSEWDLDRLILFLWLSKELKEHLQKFNELLAYQTGWLQYRQQSPSLILIYRLVDALRAAMEGETPGILKQLDATRKWIIASSAETGGDTVRILSDGIEKLESVATWTKPEMKRATAVNP